ncbi:MAG: 16S rRNA (guanine(966)-N(2))-methyltransferase RsmD [Comamonadaceae bacterium]
MKQERFSAARNTASKPYPVQPSTAQAHEVRLIGGQWKRTKLAVLDKPGLRPTPDRVRETLFNWLGQDLTGWRCIDAFAGTGALGFEAASRGAKEVLMVEQDTALVAQLKRVQTQLQASATRIVRGDGVAALKQLDPASMHAVFLDPPFESILFDAVLRAAGHAVAADGFVYLEAPVWWTDAQLVEAGLCAHRHLRAGAVHAHLLRRLA